MSSTLRYEIMIDSVATHELLEVAARFEEINCTVHKALASQAKGYTISEDDLSDALSSHLFIAFVPKKLRASFEKALFPLLKNYRASTYVSSCEEITEKN